MKEHENHQPRKRDMSVDGRRFKDTKQPPNPGETEAAHISQDDLILKEYLNQNKTRNFYNKSF